MLYIAYTREDALFAVQLVEDLADLGIPIWLDLNQIEPGADWEAAQQAAIAASEGMIVILSPEALEREHIQREVNPALISDKPVYLVIARPVLGQDWMRNLPIVDFTAGYEAGLNTLLPLLMGDAIATTSAELDPAEAFLRQAETEQQSKPAHRRRGDRTGRSIFSRLRRPSDSE